LTTQHIAALQQSALHFHWTR